MTSVSRAASKFGEWVGLTGAPGFFKSENVIDLIIADHREAESLYDKYKATTDQDEKQLIANNLVKVLVKHDECEQLLVYPLLREKIGGERGEQLYERSLKEHQDHRELLYDVKCTSLKTDPEFDAKLQKAIDSVFHHVKEEEEEVLPLLREHVTEDELRYVGTSFKAHKPLTATRPHPSAPAQGYPAALANVVLKPIDMVRDMLEGH
ncbi:hypothetical protein INT47_004758 [Mucor saturninus]|uniref:Hemerythrin-like domain-containing protein n=1 Tax=Mucor saturninus TaxID=64648 RepID=A0A8H7V641_9FUNG|nr:hypothetical protein INT47_004758 [Mucor saturninus]